MTEKNGVYDFIEYLDKFNELQEEHEQLKQVAKDFVENPTQHNLWKLRTVVLKDSDVE